MNRSFIISLLVGGSILFGMDAKISFAVDGQPTWNFSLVASNTPLTYFSSPKLAFDHYGTPSVTWSALSESAASTVTQSQFSSLGLWSHRQISTGAGVGLETAIAFDRAERPTVAWINSTGAVRAQFNTDAAQNLTSSAHTSRPAISLSTDLAGNFQGIYNGSTPGALYDVRFTGGTFSSTNVATLSGVNNVYDTRLTTDYRGLRQSASRALLSSSGQWAVMLASEPQFGGPWSTGTLVTADSVDGVDIQTDPTDGRIAIAYTKTVGSTSSVVYSKFNGISFTTTQVLSSTTTVFKDVSLAFDLADGRPAIAYEEQVVSPSSAQRLSLAYLNGSSQWLTTLVDGSISLDSPAGGSRRPSLAFDDYGTSWPAIAYVDGNETLSVAFDPPAVPEPAMLAPLLALTIFSRRRIRVRNPRL